MTTNGQPEPLPNGGVDIYGRCLRCARKVETSGGCNCQWHGVVVRPDALAEFNNAAMALEPDNFICRSNES